jgi:hypothetical protein
MTPDIADIIGMARKAGFMPAHDNRVERFAALVAAAERKACEDACRKIAEGDPSDPNNDVAEYTVYGVATECADAIRARSAK